jgi:hypothetical protein
MSHRVSTKEAQQAIASGRSIAVEAGQNIWLYVKTNKGWVRARIELSSPEAAGRRLVACKDEGDLIIYPKANGADAVAALEWFDEVLHARISDVKIGFILCGDGSQEPAVAVCDHVLQGAPPSISKVPVPYAGEYGRAYCADCAAEPGTEHIRIVCYRCYLQSQTASNEVLN